MPRMSFYSVAGKEIPKKEVYDDYPLYEQGVGRLSKMNFEIEQCMEELPPWILDREVSLICGVQLVPYLNKSIGILQERYANLTVHVYGIRNFFFGESVVSTRMLTGKDIAVQLDGQALGELRSLFLTICCPTASILWMIFRWTIFPSGSTSRCTL